MASEWLEYYHQLGRFVHWFAVAETRLLEHLGWITDVPQEQWPTTYRRPGPPEMKAIIDKAYRTKGIEQPAALTQALEHLMKVANVRNLILHNEPLWEGGFEWSRSNWRQRQPGEIEEIIISPMNLSKMVYDLNTIAGILGTKGEAGAHVSLQWEHPL